MTKRRSGRIKEHRKIVLPWEKSEFSLRTLRENVLFLVFVLFCFSGQLIPFWANCFAPCKYIEIVL